MRNVSTSEIKILKIVWKKGTTTTKEIAEELREYKWSRNTINTLIKRLYEKEILEIVQKKGKSFLYRSKINEEQFKRKKTEEFLNLLYEGDLSLLIEQYKK